MVYIMLNKLGIVILILLFLCMVFTVNSRHTESVLLTGFWKGSPSFMHNAELDLLMIYMGDSTIMGDRTGYILMKNEHGIIINDTVIFKITGISLNPTIKPYCEYDMTIKWDDDDGPDNKYDFFPNNQKIHYYPSSGKLIFATDNINAVLYKDHATTDCIGDECSIEGSTIIN